VLFDKKCVMGLKNAWERLKLGTCTRKQVIAAKNGSGSWIWKVGCGNGVGMAVAGDFLMKMYAGDHEHVKMFKNGT
jgi:hypothetical protein